MITHPLERLSHHLGHPAADIAAVGRLAEDELARLAEIVDEAFRNHDTKIERALQRSLNAVPRLMRGKVAKVLFPEGGK